MPAQAQDCTETLARNAVRITTSGQSTAEVYGQNSFEKTLSNGWRFVLLPQRYGWALRVFAGGREGDVDLTSLTPPFGAVPNPRDIAGWHFRNSANTQANDGSVNAPQNRRVFFLSPSLAATGGYKPSSDEAMPRHTAPDLAVDGMGWLEIKDFGLADLNQGEKARMVYLQFEACLIWPKTSAEIAVQQDFRGTEFTPEDTEVFGRCGLDLKRYTLNAPFAPRTLSGDFDGDSVLDEVVRVKHRASGQQSLALCRAGTWLDIIHDGQTDGGLLLDDGFIGKVETWSLVSKDHGSFGYDGAPIWPNPDGDVLVLERLEKEMVIVFWKNNTLRSQRIYRFVEP